MYKWPYTAQITTLDGAPSPSLVVHELNYVGKLLCGQPVEPWDGNFMIVTAQGEGEVTCMKCEKSHFANP